MFRGFMQAAFITVIVILAQTTKHIHCHDSHSDDEDKSHDSPPDAIDESHILSLTIDTFDDAVKNNKHLLVKFVAPWCGHCKNLVPAYAAAGKQLAESGSEIRLATVDATVEQDLAKKHGVRGYPTIQFFNNGTKIDYTGGRSRDEILAWLKKRTGPAAEELNTVDELNKLKETDDVVVIGAFKDKLSEAATVFLQVAATIEDIPFGITTNEDVFKELGVTKDTVILFKKFDEGRNDLTSSFDESSIRSFISANELPIVVEFTAEAGQKIFGGANKRHILYFDSKKGDNYEKNHKEFETVAKESRGKLLFVFVNTDEAENGRICEYFGIKPTDIPNIRLISFEKDVSKYKPESSDISSEVLTKFVTDYLDGKLKPHYLSQEIPEDWDKNPVKVLVGKNFHEIATDKKKTVLVAFVAPWCGHCQQLKPLYGELAEKYKDKDDVVIAQIDATLNEIENITVQGFPTIKLFPKDSDEVIDYKGERTVEAFAKFIDSNGAESVSDDTEEHEEQAEEGEGEGEGEAQAAAEAEADEEEAAHVDL